MPILRFPTNMRDLLPEDIGLITSMQSAKTDKRLGINKIKICLQNEYCLFVSTGRVYRLMKEMNLPKMSTVKPPKFKHNNA